MDTSAINNNISFNIYFFTWKGVFYDGSLYFSIICFYKILEFGVVTKIYTFHSWDEFVNRRG